MSSATPKSLEQFIEFCQKHITGKERKEAQIFLDRFFQAFGHEGVLEVGGSYEEAIKKGSKRGGTGFADLVWKPRVLIEMKKRGESLDKHYSQAFDYWMRLVPNRPRYVILCNFDEFWIFDFDSQIDEPVDIVALSELKNRASAFNFMELGNRTPVFKNNQVEVTEKAARRMGELFKMLDKRRKKDNFSELQAQGLILQCVLAMFAQDRGLLPRDLFLCCVKDCLNGGSSYDVLGGLFREMNQQGKTPAGQYKGVDYFNGGLFSQIQPIELKRQELEFLEAASLQDWNKIRPAIFGNLFEGTVNEDERHAYGIHYTSEADIMKIVRPTISRYWEEKIDAAKNIGELNQLQLELQQYRVLDPACGSGNFLYVAYQELKRIEQLLLSKIYQRRKSKKEQMIIGFVTLKQFYGMDINPFAVELARVTLMIARKVAIDKFKLTENYLPLDSLDNNIVCQDALFNNWVKADAIIGNPPFLGGYRIRQELGDNYTDKVFKKFSDVQAQIDFSTYWFRLAHENIDEKGRVGLVATNSISQGKNRVAALDYITQNGGHIHDAISSQPWSGEANVYVSIVNWSKTLSDQSFLDDNLVLKINSALKATTDISTAKRLKGNINYSFVGVQPNSKGFLIDEEIRNNWNKLDTKNQQVLKLFSSAKDLANKPHGIPSRWIIDFANMNIEEVSEYKFPFLHVKEYVKPERINNREAVLREKWWRFKRTNEAMRKALQKFDFYFNIPCHSKWFIFMVADKSWLAGNSTAVVASDDFYILGILTSNIHRIWVKVQSSTLKGDTCYTPKTCFETFPFPQNPTSETVDNIRKIMTQLHDYRTQEMEKKKWGITKLYNAFFDEPSSKLYQLHQQLDNVVMEAYKFKENDDILEQLLTLNLALADKEYKGESIIGPWCPNEYKI